MKIAFLASDRIALPILEFLARTQQLALVYTRPDTPAKRGLELTPTPVKERSQQLSIKVSTEKPTLAELQRIGIDLVLVFAYGQFIKADIFQALPTINIHPSLLPKYRGPSPIQTALLHGDKLTGVTFFFISQGMDEGDILYQETLPLEVNDNYDSVSKKVVALSEKMLDKLLTMDPGPWQKMRQAQDPAQASICKLIEKEDRRILAEDTPEKIHNKVRAFGGFVERQGKRIKLLRTSWQENKLYLELVQPEGKKPLSYPDYLNGYPPLDLGEILPK